jgi:TonB family protein
MTHKPTSWTGRGLALAALAAITGCVNPEYVSENPVNNQVQPLKPGVYSVKDVDVRPVSTHEVEPDYPPDLEPILTGKAIVAYTVRTDGKVADAAVVEADDVQFGEAAVSAIRKWRYKPALVKGAPVDCRMTLPFIFVSPYINYPQYDAMPDPSNGTPPGGSRQPVVEQH